MLLRSRPIMRWMQQPHTRSNQHSSEKRWLCSTRSILARIKYDCHYHLRFCLFISSTASSMPFFSSLLKVSEKLLKPSLLLFVTGFRTPWKRKVLKQPHNAKKPFTYSRIALPPPMHVYLVDKDMQWILLPTWSYMCGECTDATFLHLIGRVSDRYWTSLPPTRGSRRRRVDISFQTISPLKYGWWCKYSYLKTCPEYLEIIVYNLISFETPIMTCIKIEKSVVR